MRYLILISLLVPITVLAQKSTAETFKKIFPIRDARVFYSETIETGSKSPEEIFIISKKFLIDNYRSANAVIQDESKEDCRLIGKGIFGVPHQFGLIQGVDVNVYHTVRIRCKDGRANIEIYGFMFNAFYPGNQYAGPSTVDMSLEERFVYYGQLKKKDIQFLEEVNQRAISFIDRFKTALAEEIIDEDF